MATKIVTKNSSTAGSAPSASDLVQGELAVNVVDKRLYTEDNAGNIVELGTNPSTIDINAGTIDGTTIGASSASTGAFTTLSATGEITANGGIALGDNDKATFGASDDLQIYHAGSHSIINDSGTGDLRIGGSTNVQIWNAATSKLSANFNADSAATLYNNGGAKLATTSTGIDVTGTATMDGLTVDGNNSYTSNIKFDYGTSAPTYFSNWGYKSSSDGNKVFLTMTDAGVAKDVLVADYNGNVIIGGSNSGDAAADNLTLVDSGNAGMTIQAGDTSYASLYFKDSASPNSGYIQYKQGDDFMRFATGGTERMRINSSGNVGIGTDSPTSALTTNVTADGDIHTFSKSGTTVGSIQSRSGVVSTIILDPRTNGVGLTGTGTAVIPTNNTGVLSNAAMDIGGPSNRFKDIYAANGTIQTSDAREKTAVRELTDAEMRVAKKLSKNIGFFQWLTAIEKKGADARSHCGQTVQGVIAEFDAEGLNAFDYAMVCYNEWEDEFTEHPAIEAVEAVEAVEGVEAVEAVEAVDAVLDEAGDIVSEAIEAVEAVEGVDAVEAVEAVEAVDAWTEQTQEQGDCFSLRTDQLNHFMIRGLAQSQEELEARLSALEA